MMNLMDVLVEERPMERAMHPVVPCIFQHKEDRELEANCGPRWKRHTGVHTARLGHWVEEPDLG